MKPYLAFLKSGCTQDPVSLLRIAGVDLSTSQPVDEALEVFSDVIAQMEALQEKMAGAGAKGPGAAAQDSGETS